MLPSNIKDYRQLCAVLHAFHEERFYNSDPRFASRADQFEGGTPQYMVGTPSYMRGSNGLMDYWVQRHFPQMAEDFKNNSLPRPVFPLIRNVVSAKAVAFREQVSIEMVDKTTGKLITGTTASKNLMRRLRETGWFDAMRLKETYSVLFRTAASHYKIEDNELVVNTLAPYAFTVHPWHAAPGDPSRALAIEVPYYGMEYVEQPQAEPRYLYRRIPGAPAKWMGAVVDPKGKPMATLPEAKNLHMDTGTFPVVVWKESESPLPFSAPPMSMYYAQVDLMLELISATVAVRTGAHGSIAIGKKTPAAGDLAQYQGGTDPLKEGGDTAMSTPEPIRFPGSPNAIFRLPDDWQAQLLQSRVDPMKHAQWIQMKLKLSYLAEDMVTGAADIINPAPSNVSGKARLQEQMPRLLAKSRREARLREQVQRDLFVWATYWNMLATPDEQYDLDNVSFRVTFSEILAPDALADQSVVQALQAAAGMGLVDLVRLRAQIDQSTYEEAGEAFWTNVGTYKRSQMPLPDDSIK